MNTAVQVSGARPAPAADRRTVLRGLGWAGASKAVSEAARYLQVLVLARLLAPEDFGVFGITLLVLGVLEAFTEPGFKTALVQRPEGVARYLDSVFVVSAARGLLLAACIFACAPFAALFWNVPDAAPVVASAALVVLLRGLQNPAAVALQRELDFRRIFVWNCFEAVAALAAGVALAWRGLGVWALVGSLVTGEATRSAVSYWLKPWRPSLRVEWGAVRELTRFSRWVMASNAAVFTGLQLDSALVAKLVSPAALGFYQVANRLVALPRTTIVAVLSQVAYPAMCAAQEHPARLRKLLVGFWLVSVLSAGGFALAVSLFARPLVTFMFGAKWTAASPLAAILAWGQFLRSIAVVPSYYFLAAGRPGVTFHLNAARAVGLAAVVWPLTALWDAQGAAWAAVVGAVAMSAVWMVAMGRGRLWTAAAEQRGAAAPAMRQETTLPQRLCD